MLKVRLADKVAEFGCKYGMGVYSNAELFSLLTGVAPEKFGKDEDLDAMDVMLEPSLVDGIGEKKAMCVRAMQELAKRMIERREVKVIHGPDDVADYAMPHMRFLKNENFVIMNLNTKNHIIGCDTITTGSLQASIVHPRDVFRSAIVHNAACIIAIHNHPSGDPAPSHEDICVTQRLVKAGKIMDIPLLDHIIIGNEQWVSLKEKKAL